jgi:uracil-DNA glycosylase family 4
MKENKATQLAAIAKAVSELEASPLYAYREENQYQAVIGEGNLDAEIMFVGEAPGEQEAKSGRPFVGAAGRMLNELLASIHLRREDVYITNIVKDRPPDNRDPRPDEIALYTPFLLQQIAIIQPRVIATLGRFAMTFILEQFQAEVTAPKISRLHGQVLKAQTPYGEIAVVPLYHPAVALYNRDQRKTLEEDFQMLKQFAPADKAPPGKGQSEQASPRNHSARPTNDEIAAVLDQTAELLEAQETNANINAFRVRAYRSGADTVRSAAQPLAELARAEDLEALVAMPNIGEGLARVIIEFVNTGRSTQLERLQGKVSPAALFAQIPGIGDELAQRIEKELDIQTLEELEQAGYDGRLEQVEGFGPKRVKAVLASLAGMLSRSAQKRQQRRTSGRREAGREAEERPPVDLLLEIDAEYRQRAEADELPTIAPKRFNPENEAWLPMLKTERQGWSFTALFSNTARAHELEMTHDWVVIYYKRNGQEEQNTVVTETNGPLAGRRIVRGREAETRECYERSGNR